MRKMQNYRFKCRNQKCASEFHRRYSVEEFEYNQYHTSNGWACFNCGFPKMAVMKSSKTVKDGFKPGFQRSIRKYCATYSEYKRELKKRGLIEIGYEEIPEQEEAQTQYWTDGIIKKIINEFGVDLSGNEIEALKAGKF